MPGDFTLGCLLGQYDQAHSFEGSYPSAVGSFGYIEAATVFSYATADVHSSARNLQMGVDSVNTTIDALTYIYGASNDLYQRRFPDITTHYITADAWMRNDTVAASGHVTLSLWTNMDGWVNVYVPYASTRQNLRISTYAHSGGYSANYVADTTAILVLRRWPTNLGARFYVTMDDALTRVDEITLTPEFDFIEESRLPAARHRTQGGVLHTYQWTRHWAWRVPLRFLSNSHADLINWWWVNGFALAFMLDTSDQNTVYTAKIVNETQPIGSKIKPYALNAGGWAGVLELESLDQGSLVY